MTHPYSGRAVRRLSAVPADFTSKDTMKKERKGTGTRGTLAGTLLVLLLCCIPGKTGAQTLSLDSCRALALRNNKTLAIARATKEKALNTRKAARTNYFPKIELTAGYLHTGDEISLLNKDQKNTLGSLGTSALSDFSAQAGQLLAAYPDLAPLAQAVQAKGTQLAAAGNALGQSFADKFRTDTRNITAGAILLTQPLYMGGKIMAYARITKHSEVLADQQLRSDTQQLLLDVDKAYWQVVSLAHKRRLAVSYRDMLARLDSDVTRMIAEGVATRANGLTVGVKLNEAEMTLTKVEDGLSLSRMLLCQLCGLPLDGCPALEGEEAGSVGGGGEDVRPDAETALANRPEISQLETARLIYGEKVKIERSAFLPQLALTGGYMISNPNVFNGFEKKFRGTWGVGVMLKVPVWHWGEGRYKVRAAKCDALIASLRADDAREKVELQVSQEAFRVNEANRKYALSLKNMDKAEENLRTAQAGFREGVIPTSELLAAQTAWLQAHSDKIDAQIDTKLARAAYDKALGVLE